MQKMLRRRAEDGDRQRQATTIAAEWLKRYPPLTGLGKVRAAEILLNRGKTEAGTAALADGLDRGRFQPPPTSATCRRGSPPSCARKTTSKRLDRLLWDGQADAARRMLPLVSADYRAVGGSAAGARRRRRQCRAAWSPKCRQQLRTDPGSPSRRRAGGARRTATTTPPALLLARSDNPVRPASGGASGWLVARRLLAAGNPRHRLPAGAPAGLDRRQGLFRGGIPVRLHRAALPQGAEPGVRPFRPHPGAGRPAPMPRRAPPIGAGAPPRPPPSPTSRRNGTPPAPSTWRPSTASSRRISSARMRRRIRSRSRGRAPPSRPASTRKELVRAARLFFAAGDRDARPHLPDADGRHGEDAARFRDARLARRGAGPDRSGDRRWRGARSTPACR